MVGVSKDTWPRTWLHVIDPRRGPPANGHLTNNVVDAVVNLGGEGGKEDVAADIKVAEGSAPWHQLVIAERL